MTEKTMKIIIWYAAFCTRQNMDCYRYLIETLASGVQLFEIIDFFQFFANC